MTIIKLFHRSQANMPTASVLALMCTALLVGCSPEEPKAPAAPDAEVVSDRPNVTVDLSGFPEDARERAAALIDAVNRAPDDAESAGLAGMFAHAYERPEFALKYYERAGELAPDSFVWPYLRGVVLASIGKDADAAAAFATASAIDSSYPPMKLRQAQLLEKDGDAAAALAIIAQVTAAAPAYAQANYLHGKLALDQGDTDTAIARLSSAIQGVPHYGSAHFSLAAAYDKAGDAGLAETHRSLFEKHRRGGPPNADRLLTRVQDMRSSARQSVVRAGRLSAEGKFDEAAKVFEALLRKEPQNMVAHVNLIGLYGEMGDRDKAQSSFEKGLAIAPDTPKLHSNYGVLLLRESKFAEAEERYRKAVELDPNQASAHKFLGLALQRQDKAEAAIASFEKAVALDPLDLQSSYYLGAAQLAAGDFDTAADTLQGSLEPPSRRTPGYLRALAQAQFSAGRLDAAKDALERARLMASGYGQGQIVAEIDRELEQVAQAGANSP